MSVLSVDVCSSVIESQRGDCGWNGINQIVCQKQHHCCWKNSTTKDVPWCFYDKNVTTSIKRVTACEHHKNAILKCNTTEKVKIVNVFYGYHTGTESTTCHSNCDPVTIKHACPTYCKNDNATNIASHLCGCNSTCAVPPSGSMWNTGTYCDNFNSLLTIDYLCDPKDPCSVSSISSSNVTITVNDKTVHPSTVPAMTSKEQLTSSIQLPNMTSLIQLADMTPSIQLPDMTPSIQLPDITPSTQRPAMKSSIQLPNMTSLIQLPDMTPSTQLPAIKSSIQLTATSLTQLLPARTFINSVASSIPDTQIESMKSSSPINTIGIPTNKNLSTPTKNLSMINKTPAKVLSTSIGTPFFSQSSILSASIATSALIAASAKLPKITGSIINTTIFVNPQIPSSVRGSDVKSRVHISSPILKSSIILLANSSVGAAAVISTFITSSLAQRPFRSSSVVKSVKQPKASIHVQRLSSSIPFTIALIPSSSVVANSISASVLFETKSLTTSTVAGLASPAIKPSSPSKILVSSSSVLKPGGGGVNGKKKGGLPLLDKVAIGISAVILFGIILLVVAYFWRNRKPYRHLDYLVDDIPTTGGNDLYQNSPADVPMDDITGQIDMNYKRLEGAHVNPGLDEEELGTFS